jgi:uncharacterized MnhB-related membrane protein
MKNLTIALIAAIVTFLLLLFAPAIIYATDIPWTIILSTALLSAVVMLIFTIRHEVLRRKND